MFTDFQWLTFHMAEKSTGTKPLARRTLPEREREVIRQRIHKRGRDGDVCGEKSFRAFCSFSKVISRASMREISICVAN